MGHPTVMKEKNERGGSRFRRTVALKVVYRLDRSTQHKKHTSVIQALKQTAKSAESKRPKDNQPRANSGRRLLAVHAMQHFRATLDKYAYYSIAFPPESMPFLHQAFAGTRDYQALPLPVLDDHHDIPALLRCPAAPSDPADTAPLLELLDSEQTSAASTCPKPEPTQCYTVFSVVRQRPSRRKLIQLATCAVKT